MTWMFEGFYGHNVYGRSITYGKRYRYSGRVVQFVQLRLYFFLVEFRMYVCFQVLVNYLNFIPDYIFSYHA